MILTWQFNRNFLIDQAIKNIVIYLAKIAIK
jgi:hypothetical protein